VATVSLKMIRVLKEREASRLRSHRNGPIRDDSWLRPGCSDVPSDATSLQTRPAKSLENGAIAIVENDS